MSQTNDPQVTQMDMGSTVGVSYSGRPWPTVVSVYVMVGGGRWVFGFWGFGFGRAEPNSEEKTRERRKAQDERQKQGGPVRLDGSRRYYMHLPIYYGGRI